MDTTAYMMTRIMIGIDSELGEELREFAEKKHGTLHGAMKVEAENAIRTHIQKGDSE